MDYYCSAKFTELMVHVQGRLLYNCCKAYPERVDLDWLEANPGRLFHTDTMLEDRKLMLDNKSCASCHHGCYKYEEQGLQSHRQKNKQKKQILDPNAPLKSLQIVLSTDCNLACVYCSPEWSTAWYKDISNNGEYKLDGLTIGNDQWSTLYSKLKQKNRSTETRFFKLLLNEIDIAKDLVDLTILGGEPLLHNQLQKIVETANDKKINIVTGLGVSDNRLQSILKAMSGKKIKFLVSAEATGKYFEFIRHGLQWNDFKRRVEMITEQGYEVKFISTLSNLSFFDIHNFYTVYNDRFEIIPNFLTSRDFMLPHVMDEQSKDLCRENLKSLNGVLSNAIEKKPSEFDRKNLANYLKQISNRRGVDLGFLPKHFLEWCGIDKITSL